MMHSVDPQKFAAIVHEAASLRDYMTSGVKLSPRETAEAFSPLIEKLNHLIEPPNLPALSSVEHPEQHIGQWCVARPLMETAVIANVQKTTVRLFFPKTGRVELAEPNGVFINVNYTPAWGVDATPIPVEETPNEPPILPTQMTGTIWEDRQKLQDVAIVGCIVEDNEGNPTALIEGPNGIQIWKGDGIAPTKKGGTPYTIQYWPGE